MVVKQKWKKILQAGKGRQLSEEELLSLLLDSADETLSANLLDRFKGLAGVCVAASAELRESLGSREIEVARLLALGEIYSRINQVEIHHEIKIGGTQDAYNLFHPMAFERQEVVCAAFLTSSNELIRKKEMFRGSLCFSFASPREIVRDALELNAARIVVAHNHPSQSADPSDEDVHFTIKLKRSCELMDIDLLDHLIICEGGTYYSFAESITLNWLSPSEPLSANTLRGP